MTPTSRLSHGKRGRGGEMTKRLLVRLRSSSSIKRSRGGEACNKADRGRHQVPAKETKTPDDWYGNGGSFFRKNEQECTNF